MKASTNFLSSQHVIVPDINEETGKVLNEHQATSDSKGILFSLASGKNDITGEFIIAKLKFKVSENAQIGDKYSIKWDENSFTSLDGIIKESIEYKNCGVTVIQGTPEQTPTTPTNVKVSISPSGNISLKQGDTQNFVATVNGDNLTDKSVTWSVRGANSANTNITSDGILTVGSDETAEQISVVAVSVADNTASATVAVSIEKKVVEEQPKDESGIQPIEDEPEENGQNEQQPAENEPKEDGQDEQQPTEDEPKENGQAEQQPSENQNQPVIDNNEENKSNVTQEDMPSTGSNVLTCTIIILSILSIVSIISYRKIRY